MNTSFSLGKKEKSGGKEFIYLFIYGCCPGGAFPDGFVAGFFIFKRHTLIKRNLNSSGLNLRREVEVSSRFKPNIPANPNHPTIVP
jgi:hypothetical protein